MALSLSAKLYGITFEETFDIDKYNDEVTTYEVKDKDQLVAIFYADFFPRKGKEMVPG
jgi:peptidyl-dipeptidase Dcp